MSRIAVEPDQMEVLLRRTENVASDASAALGGFVITADGGIASDKIAFIVRMAIEAAQLAADATNGLATVARAAVTGQLGDEAEVFASLQAITAEHFG